MTICIAAICDNGHTLILAADREIGIGFTSADFPDGKFGSLCKDWSAGIAGTVSNATDVYDVARTRCRAVEHIGTIDVRAALEIGYREARMRQAEAMFLANRGLTLKEFRELGSNRLPITTYANIDAHIAAFDFQADLIVAGFGEENEGPAILSISNPGVCLDHSKIGFWCIGSGSTAAQMSLFSRNYSWKAQPEKASCYILEAKIAAERATGVGGRTDIYLIRRGASPIAIQDPTMDKMKSILEELKPKEFEEKHDLQLRNLNEFGMLRQR